MIQKLMGMPMNASAHGGQVDLLIFLMHLLMAVLFVVWTGFFLYLLYRFRRGRQPKANYLGLRTRLPLYAVGLIALAELALEASVSTPFWEKRVHDIPTGPNVVQLRVIAQQFAWNIHYPGPDGKFGRTELKLVNDDNAIGLDRDDPAGKDDIVTINQMHVPVNTPVVIELTTKDVIHSLFIPTMRVKQDAIPGMLIPVHFTPAITSDALREKEAFTVKLPTDKEINWDLYVPMEDYKDKAGKVIARRYGRTASGVVITLSEKTVKELAADGLTEIRVGPAYPMEIACAQLCGLNHYRMKGYLTVDEPAAYQAWLKKQAEFNED